jgi:uncharacterized protein
MSDSPDGASCPMPDRTRDDELRGMLGRPRVIAVVGMSPKVERPSHEVGVYLAEHGFQVIPVHPKAAEVAGLKAYPDLRSIPGDIHVDIVDLFVSGDRLLGVVDQSAEIGADVVWFQPGAEHADAEQRARAAGMKVVSGICTMAEHRRLFTA